MLNTRRHSRPLHRDDSRLGSRFFRSRAWAALGAMGLGACSSVVEQRQWGEGVEAALPESYEIADERIEFRNNPDWFTFFDDEELKELVRYAFSSSPSLNGARARIEQADAEARIAGAAFWPTLEASFDARRGRQPIEPGGGAAAPSQQQEQFDPPVMNLFNASLAASYEIDVWGRLGALQESATLAQEAALDAFHAASMSLAASLTERWLDYILSLRRLELLSEQLEISRDLLDLTEKRLAFGQGSALNLSRQRQQYDSVMELVERERARLEVARSQLATLAGVPPQSAERLPDLEQSEFPDLPEIPEPGLPGELIYRRPDIRAALMRLRSQDRRVAAAVAERLPAIRLQGSLFGQAAQLAELFDTLFWQLGASIAEELFSGGREQARIELREAQAREAYYDFRDTLVNAFGEIASTAARYAQQKEVLQQLQSQREAADEAVEFAMLEFGKGELPYLEVLDAVRSQQQVQQSLADGRRQMLALHVQLCRALGGAWPPDLRPDTEREPVDQKEGAKQ